jgi:hypothetical protein
MKRGRKPFTREHLALILQNLEKIPDKTPKDLARIGTIRRRLGIFTYGRGQTKDNKLTIIKVKDYIKNGGSLRGCKVVDL